MDCRIHELGQNQTVLFTKMWGDIESYQIRQNNTLGDIENNLFEARKTANETYRNLQNKFNTNAEKGNNFILYFDFVNFLFFVYGTFC